MKQETKTTLKGIVIILLFGTFLLSIPYGMRKYQYRDKFKVGDIVEVRYEREFSTSIYYHKIVKVGKEYYLTKQYNSQGYMFDDHNEELKSSLNERGELLNN